MNLFVRFALLAATFTACSSSNSSTGQVGGNGGNPASSGSAGAGASGAGVGGGAGGASASSGGSPASSGSGGARILPPNGGAAGSSSAQAGSGGQAASGGSGGRGGTAGGGGAGGGGAGGGAGGGTSTGGPSAGCSTPIMRPNPSAQQMMDVGGAMRTYLLDVPTAADNKTPLPLIFALHGANMTNTQVVGNFNFDTRSGGKVITVYPQGDQTASGARWTSNDTNWTYIQTLMTDLESRYCVDTSKVFLTGFSMGGGFTMDTACQKSSMFRAFATVEGYGPGGVGAATKPVCSNAGAKVPLLSIQGSTDTTVTPEMGQASLAFWTGKNGCSATTSMPMGAGFTSCTANEDCTSTLPVYYCTGTWNHTITSTAAGDVWAFFSSFK